jgi:hypothetical protein
MHMPGPYQPAADPAPSGRTATGPSSGGPVTAAHQFATQVQGWANSSAAMKTAAEAGGFAVDPASGQAYVDAYNFALDRIRELRTDLSHVVLTYQLGTSPGAQKIAPWNLEVAQELEAAFSQLPTIYTNARDAYAQAMTNYQQTEHGAAASLRKSAEL